MTYTERTEEWAPNPDKSEHIFISIVVKAALEHHDTLNLIDMSDFEGNLGKLIMETSRAWKASESTRRRGRLDAFRQTLQFASTNEQLMEYAKAGADIPQTKAERAATLEIFQNIKQRMVAEQANPWQDQGQGPPDDLHQQGFPQ
jgi:hypothetical protein